MAHHFTFSFVGVGHQVIRVRIDLMSGPPSSHECVCVCGCKTGAPALPAYSDVLCVCVFWRGRRLKRRRAGGKGGFEFNRTPIARCLSRVLAFYLLSVLFCAPPPHHHQHPHTHTLPLLLPFSLFLCVCWLMSLSLCLDSVRHCVTSCLQTHRLRDNITVAETEGRERGREERQMYRQSLSGGGMGISHTSIIGYVPWSQLFVV